jgi:hypothetical protein
MTSLQQRQSTLHLSPRHLGKDKNRSYTSLESRTYQSGFFNVNHKNKQKKLFWQGWFPEPHQIRSVVLIYHELHAHSARYMNLIDALTQECYAVSMYILLESNFV